jgi:hypothetical protein
MFCSECGANINDDVKFCVECGATQLNSEEPVKSPKVNSNLIAGLAVIIIVGVILLNKKPAEPEAPLMPVEAITEDIKPVEQYQLEKKVANIHAENKQSSPGTRENEEAFTKKLAYVESIKGTQVKDWVCKYESSIVWDPANKTSDDGTNNIECIDLNGTVFDAKFSVKFKNDVGKIYSGDLLKFSGNVTYFDTGAGLGYQMEVGNAQLDIVKK